MIEDLLPKEIFWNDQTLSAEVIYIDAVHTQRNTADFTGNQTQRQYLQRLT